MQKVLIAVDDSKGSLNAVNTFLDIFKTNPPGEVVLLYTEKIEGHSLMDEMLGDAELSELKKELKGTEYQAKLDIKAAKILAYFRNILLEGGVANIKNVVKEGHPADEIIKTANDENAGMIVVGSRGKRQHGWLMGSVSREVSNRAEVSVLVAK